MRWYWRIPNVRVRFLKLADVVGSTAALLKYAVGHPEKEYIVATESGILHEMQKKCPQTKFIPAPPNDSTCACNECNFMRLNTLEKLYDCLKKRVSGNKSRCGNSGKSSEAD